MALPEFSPIYNSIVSSAARRQDYVQSEVPAVKGSGPEEENLLICGWQPALGSSAPPGLNWAVLGSGPATLPFTAFRMVEPVNIAGRRVAWTATGTGFGEPELMMRLKLLGLTISQFDTSRNTNIVH